MTEYSRATIMGTHQNYDGSGLNGDYRGVSVDCSGSIYMQQQSMNAVFVSVPLVVTGASGGQAFGSGLTTSGYIITNVVIENPPVYFSGTSNYNLCYNSGLTNRCVYIGGYSGNSPYPGSGFITSGKGFVLFPGVIRELHVPSLDSIYVAAETSGNILSYMVELVLR
jgi:hypothetical protein